jgi:selenocysteine lyase/cysteine desulfurase
MNEPIAYFDNAATTYPKPEEVYRFADSFYRDFGGNIGRGGNALAVAAGEIARQAKDNLRALYSCPAREIAFTSSATDALNRILLGLGIKGGDHIYVSPLEHNAVTRPVRHLVKTCGATMHVLPFSRETLLPDLEAIEDAFSHDNPRLVILTHASNVCGAVIPVLDIAAAAKTYGACTVVDMSQTAGLLDLDLEGPLVDYAVFAGHKTLYSPFGIGGFFCRRDSRLNPVFFGGNGINSVEQDMPDEIVPMTEIGSQNTYAIAGLKASTDWILKQGMGAVRDRESSARDELLAVLRSHDWITLVADGMQCDRIGVASILLDGLSPDEAEMVLGRYGVAVRSGIQCAPFAHEFLGTLPGGTVRLSVSALTNSKCLARLADALEEIEGLL